MNKEKIEFSTPPNKNKVNGDDLILPPRLYALKLLFETKIVPEPNDRILKAMFKVKSHF